MKRANFVEHLVICNIYFSPDCYKKRFMGHGNGAEKAKSATSGAVPTIQSPAATK